MDPAPKMVQKKKEAKQNSAKRRFKLTDTPRDIWQRTLLRLSVIICTHVRLYLRFGVFFIILNVKTYIA